MTKGLVRYQQAGDLHFITFSCYGRKPYLASPAARELFEASLEKMRRKYGFAVLGYVVMPEHVHLLVNEPALCLLSRALQALKISVSVQRSERPFWLRRYYDFNVHSAEKIPEKLRYLHRNPVARGLVQVGGTVKFKQVSACFLILVGVFLGWAIVSKETRVSMDDACIIIVSHRVRPKS